MAYCGEVFRPKYLYVEDVGALEQRILATSDFTLALHVHVFKHSKPQHLRDAVEILRKHPNVKWIPDTAHQTIAGDNPVQALRIVPEDRIASVHIKDWSSLYGRTSHRYSKGFCELGRGEVPLSNVIHEIRSKLPRSWIVVEQDYTLDDASGPDRLHS
jgi:sugar phosphate isomerase/epimerase